MNKQKIIAFDLDDVLCTRSLEYDYLGPKKYLHCEPVQSNIQIVNNLYEKGHTIVIYTARGMTQFSGDVSKIYSELYQITYENLKIWGVKFHQLVMGKISYDVLIDDKCLNSANITINDIEKFL
jgi:hydroxymethylpyrimidine pyrophosphatase-like HAD family hydrolase